MSNFTIDPYRFGIDCSLNVISCSNKAYSFDGVNDWLKLLDHVDFSFDAVNNGSDINLAHSVCVYLNRSNVTLNEAIYSKGNGNSSIEYRVFFLNNDLYCDTYDITLSHYNRKVFSNLNISNGTWFHLSIAFGTAGSEVTVWLDGVSLTGYTGSGGGGGDMEDTSTMFRIGDMAGSSGYQYLGLLMQFMLWKDHKLTQAEVDYIYDSGTSLRNPTINCGDYQVSNKLKLWIKEEDGVDHSGNGHDMVLKNGLSHDTTGNTPC
jgi:hypothetical protein